MKLIFFPRLKNGNVLWKCDDCGAEAEVSEVDTRAVSLVCVCDMKCHPKCNQDWYYKNYYCDPKLKKKYEPGE